MYVSVQSARLLILPYHVGQQFVCLTSTLSTGVPLFRIFGVAPEFSRDASGIYQISHANVNKPTSSHTNFEQQHCLARSICTANSIK